MKLIKVKITTAVAWPLIYFIAKNWLNNYYYRIRLHLFEFLVGFIFAIIIALGTICYKTMKSVRINPANTLRYEWQYCRFLHNNSFSAPGFFV